MLNLTELESWIESIEYILIVVLVIIEIAIDWFCHNQRNYQDTGANIAIAQKEPESLISIWSNVKSSMLLVMLNWLGNLQVQTAII